MGSLPTPLVDELRKELGLLEAVETRTYEDGTALLLAMCLQTSHLDRWDPAVPVNALGRNPAIPALP
jgi:hypothetical protein